MYITKAIIFDEKDLPIIEKTTSESKFSKCVRVWFQKYCGDFGSKIEMIETTKKVKLDTFGFFDKNKFLEKLFFEKNNNKVCVYVDTPTFFTFVQLTDIKNFIDKDDFENQEDIKKLIKIFKELNIPYTIDIVVI